MTRRRLVLISAACLFVIGAVLGWVLAYRIAESVTLARANNFTLVATSAYMPLVFRLRSSLSFAVAAALPSLAAIISRRSSSRKSYFSRCALFLALSFLVSGLVWSYYRGMFAPTWSSLPPEALLPLYAVPVQRIVLAGSVAVLVVSALLRLCWSGMTCSSVSEEEG